MVGNMRIDFTFETEHEGIGVASIYFLTQGTVLTLPFIKRG